MHPAVVPLLDQFGVLSDLVDSFGFRRLTRTRIYLDDCIFEGPMDPSGFWLCARAHAATCSTILLVQRAMRFGAEFHDRTRAERLIWNDGRVVGAELRDADGERREVRCAGGSRRRRKVLVGWQVGRRRSRMRQVPALRPVYYAHFHGIEPLPEPAVELFFGSDRIAFVFPMRPGEFCLALELQPEDFERFASDAAGEFLQVFDGLYGMRSRMRHANSTARSLASRVSTTSSANRMAPVGRSPGMRRT